MALGLSVIFGVVRVVNFAHGEMMTIAMYIAIVLFQTFKLDPLVMMVPIAGALFALGAACVGAAGSMLVLIIDVTPPLGPQYTLLAFVIVITGGLGSMPGALVGGVLIGMTEALAGLLFTPSAKSMFAFAILVLVLLFRPQGLLGKRLT